MTEIELFNSKTGINSEYYSAIIDNEGYVTRLSFYDLEYDEFIYDFDLLGALSIFPNLKELDISLTEYEITDLSGLIAFPGLERLMLANCCKTNDISVLKNLKHLTYLYIDNAGITNIEPLAELTALQNIVLPWNKIGSIDVLKNHTNLVYVNLSGNKLTDISALAASQELQNICVDDNELKDISFLRKLRKIEYLHFSRNSIENVDFLESLVLLKTLLFSGNPVKSISALSELNNLINLSMADVPVKDIRPIKQALNLTQLHAGPVEDFDCCIVSHFTNLNGLQLNQCNISDVSFLQPLKKLYSLNLDDNNISNLAPLYLLKQVSRISLRNNKINEPFQQFQFNNLNSLNLQGNLFGTKLYENSYWGNLAELDIDAADYWLERGEDDNALACHYINAGGKIPIVIYYKKLLECEPDDDYFRLYYVMRCEIRMRNLKEEDQEILNIKTHLIGIIKESNFFCRSELLVSLEEGGKNVLNYNQYSEYAAYLKNSKHVKPHPEMLYNLGSSTLKNRDALLKMLSIYKQLIELQSPFYIALMKLIKQILQNNFSGTPEDINRRARFQHMLTHPNEHEIPFFDTAIWFEEKFGNYVHDRIKPRVATIPKPTMPPSYSYERSYPETSILKIFAGVLLLAFALLLLLKACN